MPESAAAAGTATVMTASANAHGTAALPSPALTEDAWLVVIVPAHSEAEQLPATIASLRRQTRIPDEIIVVSDNSTDDTVEVALSLGVTVMATVDNRARKAGAINQVLSRILAEERPDFFVLVMDADTELSAEWLATAVQELAADPRAAVSGTYLGAPVRSNSAAGIVGPVYRSLVAQLQFNEFERASRLQYRKHRMSIWCLSGTGTMARASMFREIASGRGSGLPGRYGEVYDAHSSTEDFELTLAARSLGYRCVIPVGCASRTEVMPTMRAWFKQRLRWQYGTLQSLLDYGFTRVTWGWKGWTRQAMFHLRFLGQFLLWFLLAHALFTSGATFPPFILACLVVVYAERLVSVWGAGWRGRVLAALLVPEFLYGVSEGAYLATAIWKIVRREPLTEWGHLS
jgi:cellulose synthase/poly-beta-1,6-N-acetylglucosamine synthase-like glycosyltransferase